MPARAEDVAALLGQVPAFERLGPEQLDAVAAVAMPRRFDAGEAVFREGDASSSCYLVRSGHARAIREHVDGRQITLATFGPGEIFGELAMFGGDVRSATVEAVDDVRAVALLAADLKRLLGEHPEIGVKLLGALSGRLREANARIARQSFQKVSSRVAGVLAELAETGAPGDSNGVVARSDDVVVRSTQADIAQLAGTSREAASRFLATLQRAGVVTCKRGRVIVHDPPALHRYIY